MSDYKNYNLLSVFKISFNIYPVYLVLFFIFIIISALIEPINVLVMKRFLDGIVAIKGNGLSPSNVIQYFIILMFIQFYLNLNPLYDYFGGTKFNQKIRSYFKTLIIDKISRVEYEIIEDSFTYNLIHRVKKGTENNIKDTLHHFRVVTSGLLGLLGVLYILYTVGWWISLTSSIITLMTIMLAYRCATRKFEADVAYSEAERKVAYFEGIFGDRLVSSETKLFQTTNYIKSLFIKSFDTLMDNFFKLALHNTTNIEIVLRLVGYLFIFSAYVILLFPLYNNSITIGFYIATTASLMRFMNFIITTLPSSLQYIFESKLYWKDVDNLFLLDEKDFRKEQNSLNRINEIKFSNVYFKYPGSENYIIKDLTLTLKKDKHYAIVGKNGAGKSTLIKLLTGLYKVEKGSITINGINIENFSAIELSELFSVTFQDFEKYNIPIIDYITLPSKSSQDVNLDKVESLIDKLQLRNTMEKLPNRYNTVLGKLIGGGIDLSGGEWQKLALCRSLYSKADVRILDEPTAALDPKTESELYKLFEDSISKNSTTIFISHRLGSTKFADEIILLEDGMLKEIGTHHYLMELEGEYCKMFNTQKNWHSN